MKLLLIGFLTVQITAVICASRRHGSSSRNSASFMLRKVCVEVAGIKEKVVGLEQDIAAFKEDIVGLEQDNAAFKEDMAGLEQYNAAFKEDIAGLEQDNAAFKEDIAGLEQDNAAFKEDIAGLEQDNAALKEDVAGLEEKVVGLEKENAALKEDVAGLELEITTLKQPDPLSAFSINDEDATYDDDNEVVIWSSPKLNIGQHYDNTTGKYNAPYNGTYMFQLHMYKKRYADFFYCRIKKNSGLIATAIAPSETANNGNYESSTSVIVHLEEGDKVYVGDCDNFSYMDFWTAFNGVLLDKD